MILSISFCGRTRELAGEYVRWMTKAYLAKLHHVTQHNEDETLEAAMTGP